LWRCKTDARVNTEYVCILVIYYSSYLQVPHPRKSFYGSNKSHYLCHNTFHHTMAPRFIKKILLIGFLTGILSGCDRPSADKSVADNGSKPEDNRFTPVVLTPEGSLDEPMMFEVAEDRMVYIIERKGRFKKFDPTTKTVKTIGTISVFTGNEQGLIGLTLDPAFEKNHWVYLHYAPEHESVFKLTRFTIQNDSLTEEKTILKIPVDRDETNHTGGGMAWDKNGNLYLTVGNNTGNRLLAQTDERPGFEHMDDQRAASNTNDLRGKILRIHPEADGTYTIPKGNLFPPGTAKTRPEIYTMGHRNVWRVSVDSKTGWIYWGEIGPDKDIDSETGPRGYDEQNQAKGPGFFGWPYFIADNQAIPKYDFKNNRLGEKLDPAKPKNTSPNNTGLIDLPPAQPALIYYPYAQSEKFPLVGSSSRCAIGGPVYHRDDFKKPDRPFPSYYEGKWLMADYSRFWIMAVTLDDAGNYKAMERFAPHYHPVQPLDIKFGPDGDLYVLEYGSNTVRSAAESRLVRVEYNSGNRKPMVAATAARRGGAVPFTTTLNSAGTKDFDNDELAFEWKIMSGEKEVQSLTGENPNITLKEPGVYTAILTVTDSNGEKNQASVRLIAGNEPPDVKLNITGNKTFFFDNNTFQYNVDVTDKEDGDLSAGKISANDVSLSIDYASEGFDYAVISLAHAELDAKKGHTIAQAMIKTSDCRSCHTIDTRAVGPSFKEIAERYSATPASIDSIATRILNGSSGIWKMDNNMPAHPTMSITDARTIVKYILSLDEKETTPTALQGTYKTTIPKDDNGRGNLIIRAAYTDKGAGNIPVQTSDTVVVLRSPKLNPLKADVIEGGALRDQLDEYIFLTTKANSHIIFKNIDLTDVREILFIANWHLYDIYPGGKIEIRVDGLSGEIIGETTFEPEQYNTRYRGAFDGLTNPTPDQQQRMKRYPALKLSEFFARGVNKNDFTIPSSVTIKSTKGKHDIYFVFKGKTSDVAGALFPLAEIVMKK
jgi:cytochrome c